MDIQEILVMTLDDNIKESVASTLAVYKELKELLKGSTYSFLGGVDPEGGFVTGLDNYESLKLAIRLNINLLRALFMVLVPILVPYFL